ncbi:MAG: acid phosphatase type 7 [Trebonia sp.]|nr:acid phosphatase type 7 [Trebonia sp.]
MVTTRTAAAAGAGLPGASIVLTRAPYLTDLTQTSVRVSWATSAQYTGVVQYGPPGNCQANSVIATGAGSPVTVGSVTEYQNSVTVSGLSAATSYCYRVTTTGASPVDLLGTNPSPQFTTLEPQAGTAPLTFDVLGDWGDTTSSGDNTTGALNQNQAGVDAQIAASGAQFTVSAGDVAYPGGTQTEYGDLNQTGVNVSAVFGPSYWAVPGESIPYYAISGNHGLNSTFITEWPESATTAASGGEYGMYPYPSIDGTAAASYPTSYYAFSSGGVRFYMLDAAWGDTNTGSATGGACGSSCAAYQVDHDAHWAQNSPEYTWLQQDLAAHPGGLKFAFFHYPLYSSNATQVSDPYLDHLPGSTGSLEQLLQNNGVDLAFNGHAHIYERNVAVPGGVTNYVTGGGGGSAEPVSKCASTDAYALGWSYSSSKGSACGSATAPTGDSQVYDFLKVAVNGTTVTVTPVNAAGGIFDPQTYNFVADTTPPSAPGNLAGTAGSTKNVLTWTAASDNIGVAAYDVYRNGTYLATVPASVTSYTDKTATSGTGYTYQVAARDLAGNTTRASVNVNGGPTDTTPPTAPGNLTATATSPTTIALSWQASSDNIGVTGYAVYRDGTEIATVDGSTTSYSDGGLIPGTTHAYTVTAADGAGNVSPASNQASATTQADTTPPSAPGTPVAAAVTASQVSLSWTASTDNVGVVGYRVIRNGSVIATVSGTMYIDSGVSASTSYTYQVVAADAAGNTASSGTLSVITPAPGTLFSDGFETGDLSQWTTNSGMTAETAHAHAGAYGAEESSTGATTYAYKTLPGSYTELWATAWVYVVSRSTSANLVGFRGSNGGSIINLYLSQTGKLALRNNVSGATTTSTTSMPSGSWHQVVLHALVNGSSGSVDVSLDGVTVSGLSLTGQNLGTNPITALQLGDNTGARTYDIDFDDISVMQSS